MVLALQILLGLLGLICFLGGLNLLNKGAMAFLPKDHAPALVLDNLFRFMAGIYFGLAFLVSWCLFNVEQQGTLIILIGLVVVFAGLGRMWSMLRVGSAGKMPTAMMILEIALGLLIMALQWMR